MRRQLKLTLLCLSVVAIIALSVAAFAFAEEADTTVDDVSINTQSTTALWTRLAGNNRYGTMAAIVDEAFADESADTVIVATGENYPDALAANALAGVYDAPIILTSSSALSDEASTEITRLGATKAIIVGGESSVSSTVQTNLEGMGLSVTRVSDDDRITTALAIYEQGKGSWGTTAIVVTGYSFADALSVSPVAYAEKYPIFLASSDGSISDDVLTAIEEGGFTKVIICGGTNSVTSAAADELANVAGVSVVTRLGEANRYQTSAAIADDAVAEGWLTYDNLAVATGQNFPDALAGSVLCGKKGSVLLLADDDGSANVGLYTIANVIAANVSSIDQGYILGGTNTVTQNLQDTIEALFVAVDAETPAISAQPISQTVTSTGDVVGLSVTASVSDGGTLSYQWYQKNTSTDKMVAIDDATSSTYTPTVAVDSRAWFYCVVTNTITDNGDGGAKTASTTSDLVYVERQSENAPVIATQPVGQTVLANGTFRDLTIAATGTGALSYQWYSNTSKSTTDATVIDGAVDTTYTPSVSEGSTTYYYCVVTNTVDGTAYTTTSDIVALTCEAVVNAVAPTISIQPASGTYGYSSSDISVGASSTDGGTLSYQWYSSDDNSTFTAISNATSASYALPKVTADETRYYYCVVTDTITDNGDGGTKTASTTSSTATAVRSEDTTSETTFTFSDSGITASGGSSSNYAISGTSLTINAAGTYHVTGTCSDGSIAVAKKLTDGVTLDLEGLTLSSSSTNCISGKGTTPITVNVVDGTTNTLAATGTNAKPVITGGVVTIVGSGALDVTAAVKNGIKTDDALVIDNTTLKVTAGWSAISSDTSITINGATISATAANNDISAGTTLTIDSGTFDLTSTGGYDPDDTTSYSTGDCLKASEDNDTDDTSDDTGSIVINGGTFDLTSSGTYGTIGSTDYSTGDGIDALVSLGIYGGTFNSIDVTGDGITCDGAITISAGSVIETVGHDGIQAKGILKITGGTFNIKSADGSSVDIAENGESYKGLKGEGGLTITGGTFTIDTPDDAVHCGAIATITGGTFTISGGDNATVTRSGNTETAAYIRADGIHADTALYVGTSGSSDGPTITINSCYEGLEAPLLVYYSGTTYAKCSDDGINAAGDNATSWSFKMTGGNLTVDAQGDGLDSNGTMAISGGTCIVYGPSAGGNGVFDYGDTNGYFNLTGGTVFGIGTSDMAVYPASGGQYYVCFNGTSVAAGATVAIKNASGTTLFTTTATKASTWTFFSSADLTSGATYYLYINGTQKAMATATNAGGSGGGGGQPGQPGGGQPGR